MRQASLKIRSFCQSAGLLKRMEFDVAAPLFDQFFNPPLHCREGISKNFRKRFFPLTFRRITFDNKFMSRRKCDHDTHLEWIPPTPVPMQRFYRYMTAYYRAANAFKFRNFVEYKGFSLFSFSYISVGYFRRYLHIRTQMKTFLPAPHSLKEAPGRI